MTESFGWEGTLKMNQFYALPQEGTLPTIPGCSKLHPTWPRTLPSPASLFLPKIFPPSTKHQSLGGRATPWW